MLMQSTHGGGMVGLVACRRSRPMHGELSLLHGVTLNSCSSRPAACSACEALRSSCTSGREGRRTAIPTWSSWVPSISNRIATARATSSREIRPPDSSPSNIEWVDSKNRGLERTKASTLLSTEPNMDDISILCLPEGASRETPCQPDPLLSTTNKGFAPGFCDCVAPTAPTRPSMRNLRAQNRTRKDTGGQDDTECTYRENTMTSAMTCK